MAKTTTAHDAATPQAGTDHDRRKLTILPMIPDAARREDYGPAVPMNGAYTVARSSTIFCAASQSRAYGKRR